MARRDKPDLTVPFWFSMSLMKEIRAFVFTRRKFYVLAPLPSVP